MRSNWPTTFPADWVVLIFVSVRYSKWISWTMLHYFTGTWTNNTHEHNPLHQPVGKSPLKGPVWGFMGESKCIINIYVIYNHIITRNYHQLPQNLVLYSCVPIQGPPLSEATLAVRLLPKCSAILFGRHRPVSFWFRPSRVYTVDGGGRPPSAA